MRTRGGIFVSAMWMVLGLSACASDPARALQRSSKNLGRAVGRGDAAEIASSAVPSARARLDHAALQGDPAQGEWKAALVRPVSVEPRAVIFLRDDYPVDVVQTAAGWRFAEDPTAMYAQDSPRHALRALVWASRAQRWDVVLRLAPKRYRMGLSADDLQIAWTEGEYAEVLRGARDAIAEHLGDTIVRDAHEAILDVGPEHRVRLERERDQWVIVDFLPDHGESESALR